MSSFEEVAKRVKENHRKRLQYHRDLYIQERAARLVKIADLMDKADARGETSIQVDADSLCGGDVQYMRLHVNVTEKRSDGGELIGYEIKW
jgi:hypothetical protein